jgi:hypothetical protein
MARDFELIANRKYVRLLELGMGMKELPTVPEEAHLIVRELQHIRTTGSDKKSYEE